MSSRHSHSSRSSRSPPIGPRTDVLENMRVLEQSAEDPYDTPDIPPTSRTFRVVAFALHLGISMLESPRGREALEITGTEVWEGFGRRGRRGLIFQGGVADMPQFVGRFLAKCRTDPPNIVVSDRIIGEGLAQRVNWPNMLGGSEDVYSPKWAALFRLNKTVIDNAIFIAENQEGEAWEKFLFLLSITVAHELVHLFVGFMVGDPQLTTPNPVNNPPGQRGSQRPGEAGHFWEHLFFGHRIEAYYNPDDPLQALQPGILYAMAPGRLALTIRHRSIDNYIHMNFANIIQHYSENHGNGFPIPRRNKPMEDMRARRRAPDFGDFTDYFVYINQLGMHRLGSRDLAGIMRMATEPALVRPPRRTRP